MTILRNIRFGFLFVLLGGVFSLPNSEAYAKSPSKTEDKHSKKNKKLKTIKDNKKIADKQEIALPSPSDPSQGPALYSTHSILIDFQTKEVLYEKNPDVQMVPSSMSKIILTYLVFKELKEGRLKLTDTYLISEKAWRKGGSKMFVQLNTRISIEDLLKGEIIVSGNDASIALAEGLCGTEEVCAAQATKIAKELGAKNSNFVNVTGWPEDNHYSTVRDLALISTRLIEDFPEYYPFYKEQNFAYNGISQMNRNPLLGSFPGADGVKTGATEAGGFGLVGSAVQEGRRLIMVNNGARSKKQRSVDAHALMQWGFSYFRNHLVAKAKTPLEQAGVWMGSKEKIALGVAKDVWVTIPRTDSKDIKVEVVYKGPLTAPLKEGQEVGSLIISVPKKPKKIVPLITLETVEKANFFSRMMLNFKYIFSGNKSNS